jgi:hypothetical protein
MGVSLGGLGGGDQLVKLGRRWTSQRSDEFGQQFRQFILRRRGQLRVLRRAKAFLLEMPAARLVMQETPATSMLWYRATMTSGTVLMPTASAPIQANALTSAGVS